MRGKVVFVNLLLFYLDIVRILYISGRREQLVYRFTTTKLLYFHEQSTTYPAALRLLKESFIYI